MSDDAFDVCADKWALNSGLAASGIVKMAPGTKMPLFASGGKSVILERTANEGEGS